MLKFDVGKVLKLILCISFNLQRSLFLRNKSLFWMVLIVVRGVLKVWCLVVNSYLLHGLFVWSVCLILYAGICAVRQFFSGCARYKSRYMLTWSVKSEGGGGSSFRVSKCVVLVVLFILTC